MADTPTIPYALEGDTYDLADDTDTGLILRRLASAHDSHVALATLAADVLARRMVHQAARAALSGCGLTGGTKCGETLEGERCPAARPYPDRADASGCPLAPRGDDLEELVTDVATGAIQECMNVGSARPMVRAVLDADGIGRAARKRWAVNALARLEGRADAFGLDPTDRHTSWAGRYDGAV